jgi:hypothetical protein
VILGTHGRGIFILDDITALEEWRPALANTPAHLFAQRQATLWVDQSRSGQLGDNTFAGQNPPFVQPPNFQTRDRSHLVNTPLITYYLGAGATGSASLEISSPDGRTRTLAIPAKPGITRFVWDGRMDAPPAPVVAVDPAAGGGRGAAGGGRGGGRGRGGPGGGRGNAPPLVPGTYNLKLTFGGSTALGTIVIRADPILK